MYLINYNGDTMKKAISLFILFLIVGIITTLRSPYLSAQTPTPVESNEEPSSSADAQKSELQQKIAEYEKKLTEVRAQKNTLAAQIDYMDTQMYIAQLRMDETEQKIVNAEKEINVLGVRIVSLDTSLDKLSKQLLERIVAGYKNRDVTLVDIMLDSNNTSKLVNRLKYYDLARDRNQKSLLQVQEAKSNFVEQKDLRERKVQQLDELQTTLQHQQVLLDQQKGAKRTLLEITNNDEQKYNSLLEEARRQITAFKSFVQTTGASIISADGLGTGEGGWYLSQRDERWATTRMGNSNESVLGVGCFITSISMVMKHDGVGNFNPTNMSSNSNYFVPGTAYMYTPSKFNGSWPNGKKYKNISYSEISTYLEKGRPVIAGVRGASHYVVLKKTDGNNFIMNDPIYGPDKKVSDYYSLSGPYGVFD